MPKRINNINKAITLLTLSDIFVWGSFTITSVLAGIYLSNKLGANTIKFIGIGTSIYLLTRGLFQIPIGIINDKYESEKDEVILLTLGILLMGIPFFFLSTDLSTLSLLHSTICFWSRSGFKCC